MVALANVQCAAYFCKGGKVHIPSQSESIYSSHWFYVTEIFNWKIECLLQYLLPGFQLLQNVFWQIIWQEKICLSWIHLIELFRIRLCSEEWWRWSIPAGAAHKSPPATIQNTVLSPFRIQDNCNNSVLVDFIASIIQRMEHRHKVGFKRLHVKLTKM